MRSMDRGRGHDNEVSDDDYSPGSGHGREDSYDDRFDIDDYADDMYEREGTPQRDEDEVVEQTEGKPKKKITHRERSRQKRLNARLKRKNSSIPLTYSGWRELISQTKKELYFKMAAGSAKIQKEPHWTRTRVKTANLISTHFYEAFMGAVILFNIFIIMMETERRSYCEDPVSESCSANDKDIWVPDLVCLILYTVELLMKIYVYQCKFCSVPWNIFDLFVVSITYMGEVFGSHFKDLVIIRVIRITRLARMLRLLTIFQELYLMLAGMAGMLRTMFWAVIMLIAVLSVCSLIAVEILKPVAAEVQAADGFGDCSRCGRAFESVSASMITFFQTLIMGEGIDDVIVPMIEANWISAMFILFTVAMVYLGISNLILSVVVEKASEARSQDAFYQNMVHKKLKADAKKVLMDFTRDADVDMSNTISLDELRNAYLSQELFRNYFKNMDMDLQFLEYAFRTQDRKGRGECSFEDFADTVVQMRNTDVGPVVSFIKLQMGEVLDEVATLSEQIQAVGMDLSSHISRVGAHAARNISAMPRQEPPQQSGLAASLFGDSWWTTRGFGGAEFEDYTYDESPEYPPPSRQKTRQKRQEEASEELYGSGSWDEVSPGDNKSGSTGEEIRKPRRNQNVNHDQDSTQPDIKHLSTKPQPLPQRLADIRAKHDLPQSTNGQPKDKKKKKTKSKLEV